MTSFKEFEVSLFALKMAGTLSFKKDNHINIFMIETMNFLNKRLGNRYLHKKDFRDDSVIYFLFSGFLAAIEDDIHIL